MDTVKIDKGNTRIIAHRGLSGIETENTSEAFVAAGNRTYYGLECDVHVTADGKYVIFHDDTTGRVMTKNFRIEETDFSTLRNAQYKNSSGRMPTLEEYLEIVRRYNKVAVIELKNPMQERHVAEILQICGKVYSFEKIIFISFHFDNLVTVRKNLPKQAVQFLSGIFNEGLLGRLAEHSFDIDVEHSVLTKEFIDKIHSNGLKVNCWTVDGSLRAQSLVKAGVDFITTNILE